jgi:hypothetical protein
MDLVQLHTELGEGLETVGGLRVLPFDARSVAPPAVLFGLPEDYVFDDTYQRGMDHLTIPVTVVVGAVSDRAARTEVMAYASGSGPKSVKAALESHAYTACDSVRVVDAEFGSLTIAAVDFLAVTFSVTIYGRGA